MARLLLWPAVRFERGNAIEIKRLARGGGMAEDLWGSHLFVFLMASAALSATFGCSKSADRKDGISDQNIVKAGDPNQERIIGDSQYKFNILGQAAFQSKINRGEVKSPIAKIAEKVVDAAIVDGDLDRGTPSFENGTNLSSDLAALSLMFGMPMKMLNQPMVFGSIISKVSDKNNEDLGDIKLGDVPPFQVELMLRKTTNQSSVVTVFDCGEDCAKVAGRKYLMDIPVTGIDSENNIVYLNLGALGSELDLTVFRKGDPVLAKFKANSSQTVRFDYSNRTLVFDVEAHLIAANASVENPSSDEIIITNRWFFKPEAPFNSSFVSRKATPGVGFFMTNSNTDPLIERWDFDLRESNQGIKYYIKHVPEEFQAAFAGSFDEWNEKLYNVIGKKVFDYEFIPEGDPRNDLLIPGDVRYNVLEWDLDNKASYGGLGPALANQYTGEVFHANVLIQGPTIVELYTKWFKVNQTAASLRASGRNFEADNLLERTSMELRSKRKSISDRSFELKLNKNLHMRIRSREGALQDSIVAKDGFDQIPIGWTYDEYMSGYFHDMVAHELGHNLGLRHNFRGSLGALDGPPSVGGVSRSVMEYLGRGYRYLDHIGEYDLMAIAYGYVGKPPSRTDWYCTDEDLADLNDPSKSAECSSNDATDDPFIFFEGQLSRAISLLVAKGQTATPEWKVSDMDDQLKSIFTGLGTYARSADETASGWSNFFNKGDRPGNVSGVKAYVLSKLKRGLCDPSLDSEVSEKSEASGKVKAQTNLQDLRAKAAELLKPVYSSNELNCSNFTLML